MTRQKREIEVIRWKKRQGCQGGRISGWSDGEAEIVRALDPESAFSHADAQIIFMYIKM